jgi:hypothetical protein
VQPSCWAWFPSTAHACILFKSLPELVFLQESSRHKPHCCQLLIHMKPSQECPSYSFESLWLCDVFYHFSCIVFISIHIYLKYYRCLNVQQ